MGIFIYFRLILYGDDFFDGRALDAKSTEKFIEKIQKFAITIFSRNSELSKIE
jgi:hypothetical protein